MGRTVSGWYKFGFELGLVWGLESDPCGLGPNQTRSPKTKPNQNKPTSRLPTKPRAPNPTQPNPTQTKRPQTKLRGSRGLTFATAARPSCTRPPFWIPSPPTEPLGVGLVLGWFWVGLALGWVVRRHCFSWATKAASHSDAKVHALRAGDPKHIAAPSGASTRHTDSPGPSPRSAPLRPALRAQRGRQRARPHPPPPKKTTRAQEGSLSTPPPPPPRPAPRTRRGMSERAVVARGDAALLVQGPGQSKVFCGGEGRFQRFRGSEDQRG